MKFLSLKYLTINIILIYPSLAFFLPKNISWLSSLPEDANLNFTEIAKKYGYKCEEYQVVTEDKYVLTLFHIPGNSSRPVFLMHGFLASGDAFILRANGSLSLSLARERENDVWVGNMRGNKYSRKHLTLDPDKNEEFWDFSFHEIACYDLPAMIDFILEKTKQSQLQAIGNSLGTTVFYVLGSMRPEYNRKIKVFVSLAPIAYLQHTGIALSVIMKLAPTTKIIVAGLGEAEFLGNFKDLINYLTKICSDKIVGYIICVESVLYQIDGPDSEELEPEFVPVVFGHYPAGTSWKNALHIAQVSRRKKFAQYDYGLFENFKRYKSSEPPEYDLSKVTMRIGLFAARNDRLSTITDTEMLIPRLPNVVEYHIMERKEANHMDFILGRHMYRDLFPHIFQLLDKNN